MLQLSRTLRAFAACLLALSIGGPTVVAAGTVDEPADRRPFPTFQVRDGDNLRRSSDDWIGRRPVLVDFWATYCFPCRYTLPELQRIQDDYGERIEVVGISIDGGAGGGFRAYQWASERGITYRLVHDAASEGRKALDIHTVPVLILVDADGDIVTDWWGEPDFDEVRAAVDQLLDEPPADETASDGSSGATDNR